MVWIKSLEKNYVNVDNIVSITFDRKCNSFVAIVGYREIRLQHKIYQTKSLNRLLEGKIPKNENEIIEKIIHYIESAKKSGSPEILDFDKLMTD